MNTVLPTDLRVGDDITIILKGTVGSMQSRYGTATRTIVTESGHTLALAPKTLAAAFEVKTGAPVPKWKIGDVISLAFANGDFAPRYTYVRGASVWIGENASNLSDTTVNEKFAEGRVKHLIRDAEPVEVKISAGSINAQSFGVETVTLAPRFHVGQRVTYRGGNTGSIRNGEVVAVSGNSVRIKADHGIGHVSRNAEFVSPVRPGGSPF